MKQIFLEYLKNQLSQDEKLRSTNSISEEDKVILDDHIASLTETIAAIENLEDAQVTQEAVDELKASLESLNETITSIKEKINQNKQEENPTMENIENTYLASKNAVHDFAQAIRKSKNGDEFTKNWNDVLSTNGITIDGDSNAEAYLPEIVKGRIQDIWDKEFKFLDDTTFTGAKRFFARWNESEQDATDSRARGHKKGDTKVAQALTMTSKLIEAQMIYKLQMLDNQTIFETDDDLINYILGELVSQIKYELVKCMLMGDGRAVDSDFKINKIEPIYRTSTDEFVTVSTATANGFLVDDLRAAADSIKNNGNKKTIMFISKADLRTLARVQASEGSSPIYMSTEQVAEQVGVSEIVTTDLLGSDVKAIICIPSAFYWVGENIMNPKLANWEDYLKNQTYFRYEIYAGGALAELKSAAVLKANA